MAYGTAFNTTELPFNLATGMLAALPSVSESEQSSRLSPISNPWLIALFPLALSTLWLLNYFCDYHDGLPVVNRSFALEPSILSRWRWAFGAPSILQGAQEKYNNVTYRLARGDADIIVLPSELIPELNRLPANVFSSRRSHSSSLTGHLNGMDIVEKTNHHVKMLLNRVTPALTAMFVPVCQRVESSIETIFPKVEDGWTDLAPLDKIVHCVSHAITLTTFGQPVCDDQNLIRLCYEHTRNVFGIMFVMRLFPRCLHGLLVWVLPDKWRLEKSWKVLESYVIPEVEKRNAEGVDPAQLDLISSMIAEAKNSEEQDPMLLTRLVGSVVAGGTYSSAAFIFSMIADLAAHPHFLEEIRQEIQVTHQRVNGDWDPAAYNSLHKLDSAMKESSRLSPGSFLVYSRYVESDCTLSNGVKLRKGQFISTSGYARAMNPAIFPNPREFDALRAYKKDFQTHLTQPFRTIGDDDYRWGAGRWACPGRFVANVITKVVLVKLLDEFEFGLIGGKRPPTTIMHEFVFFHPSTKIRMRRRVTNCGVRH